MTPEQINICIAEVFIPLTQGFVAVVDIEDFERVRGFTWRVKRNGRTNYAISDTKGYRAYMHREVLGCKCLVQHRDDDGLNNRRYNIFESNNKVKLPMTNVEINAAIALITGQVRNYYECLNAVHEAEKTLDEMQQAQYCNLLADATVNRIYIWHATAPQRCEALLRTVGKWRD